MSAQEQKYDQAGQAPGPVQAMPIKPARPGEEAWDLPSGARVTMWKTVGRDVREAIRIADGDTSLMQSALVSTCTEIAGRRITVEELDAMEGKDLLDLYAHFNAKNV